MMSEIIEEHYETIAGCRIRYLAAGSGPSLVLVHGLGNSAVVFRPNIPAFAEQFRVIALDLPGHGHSEKPDGADYDVETGVRFLADFVARITDGAPAALVGVSAGGLLCGLTAYYYPERVSRLVLIDSAGLGRELSWTLRLPSLPWLGRWLIPATRRGTRSLLTSLVYDPASIPEWLIEEVYRERIMPGNRDALYRAFRTNIDLLGLRNWKLYRRQILSVSQPVLLVWGAQDRLIPVDHAYAAVRHMRNARLHVFNRCGHWPFCERMEEFNRLLLDFLQD